MIYTLMDANHNQCILVKHSKKSNTYELNMENKYYILYCQIM